MARLFDHFNTYLNNLPAPWRAELERTASKMKITNLKNLIESFDRAYIINLPDRTDRRRSVERAFEAIGIKVPNDKVRFYSAVRPTDKGNFYALGARGSFNSHRNVLKLAAADGLRNVLVFEDDIAFRKVPELAVNNIVSRLSEESWDVVYFGYLKPEFAELKGPLAAWPHDTLGGHFYAVNGHFIDTMIQYMNECEARPQGHPDGGPMSRDGAYNHIRRVRPDTRVLLAVPNLAFQRSSRTDISPLRFFDRIFWLRSATQLFRSIKTQVRLLVDRIKSNETG
jgi:glycosyl transferase family 25